MEVSKHELGTGTASQLCVQFMNLQETRTDTLSRVLLLCIIKKMWSFPPKPHERFHGVVVRQSHRVYTFCCIPVF
jgi:hypothetical protein